MNCSRDFSRVVPPENVYDGALIKGMVRVDNLRSGEAEKRVDGNEDYADGVVVNGTSPLKVMVCGGEKRGADGPFPKGRKGSVIGLVD